MTIPKQGARRMASFRYFLAGVALTGSLVVSPALADWESKPFTWGPWNLYLEMKDAAGLGLRHVSYQGNQILGKADLPVIRVKYVREWPAWHPFSWFGLGRSSGRCGPFEDRISPPRLKKNPNCDGKKLCQAEHTIQGVKWLELGVYAKIGQYHLYQAWYLSEDGRLYPSVQSWNLSCNTDHEHHAYWRLDFDIGGSDQDQVFVLDRNSVEDNGWGPGWEKYLVEEDDKKPDTNSQDRVWFVRDYPTGQGVWVIPGPFDGESKKFSDRDVSIRKFYRDEDAGWPFGARGDLEFKSDESVQETNVVFWYVAHLPHKAAEGDRPMRYWMGPLLQVHQETP